MPLSRRYYPEWAPGEAATIGMDFSPLLPVGVGITGGSLFIETNTANPIAAAGDFTSPSFDPGSGGFILTQTRGRAVYCFLRGGVDGRDYRLIWTITDTTGQEWPRTALLLCSNTS